MKSSSKGKNFGSATLAIHGAEGPDPTYGAVATPIYQSSTFAFKSAAQGAARFAGQDKGYIYTRMGNPTVTALEEKLALLEGGCGAISASSGMAAITTTLLSFLSQGDHMVGTDAVYGPSRVVVERQFSRFGITSSFVDTANIGCIEESIRPETKVLYIETPANPTIKLTDIAACAKIADKHDLILIVDNTFMTPHLQKPLQLGAHIVVHSMTKFINGHTDVVGGVAICKDPKHFAAIRTMLNCMGGCIDPHQAWLVLRGVKSLALRMEASQLNASRLAVYLENHPAVEWVAYPGLPSHPQYELAQKQMAGSGALIAFSLKGGLAAGSHLMESLELATLAVSLGGIETLIQHPASMTHASMTPQQRLDAGITDGLVRLSVGVEDYCDLEADFDNALKGAMNLKEVASQPATQKKDRVAP